MVDEQGWFAEVVESEIRAAQGEGSRAGRGVVRQEVQRHDDQEGRQECLQGDAFRSRPAAHEYARRRAVHRLLSLLRTQKERAWSGSAPPAAHRSGSPTASTA